MLKKHNRRGIKKTVETREWGRTMQVFLFWVRNGYHSQWHTADAPIFPGHMHTPKDDGEGLKRQVRKSEEVCMGQ